MKPLLPNNELSFLFYKKKSAYEINSIRNSVVRYEATSSE